MAHIECKNPYSGEVTGKFKLESLQEQKEKVSSLKESQKKWAQAPLEERVLLVKKALKYFEDNRDEVARDITEQMGRPIRYSSGEIDGFFERANYLCSIATDTLSPEEPCQVKRALSAPLNTLHWGSYSLFPHGTTPF